MEQYLVDVEAGANLGAASVHTWPQAYRVGVEDYALRFVGKVAVFYRNNSVENNSVENNSVEIKSPLKLKVR